MYGSRNVKDGTADCSGSMTQALWSAGTSTPSATARKWGDYTTVSIHAYLKKNGFKLISKNKPVYARRGDIVIMGKRTGGSGHIGIISSGGNLTDPYSQVLLLSVSGWYRDAKGNQS